MIRSHAADPLPHTYLAPIEALAEHLHASPADVSDFLQHAKIVPPEVLLSWICAWDLKRRSE